MRIIYIHSFFNTHEMAGGTRVYDMSRLLVAWGHEVHVVTSNREAQDIRRKGWQQTEVSGINVHWLDVPYSNHMTYHERIRAFVAFALAAPEKAATLQGDVILASSPPLTVALPAIYASYRSKIPLVFEVRDLWPEIPIAIGAIKGPFATAARVLERFTYRQSAQIVTLSPMSTEFIVTRYGYPRADIHTIPNSANIDLFDNSNPSCDFRETFSWLEDRPLVLYAGTLGVINNVSYLVKLAAELRHDAPEVRFLVVGGGKEEERIRSLAQELGVLDETFFMLPWVSKKDMPALLSAATLAISVFADIEAMWSNSSKKLFDALAAGKPMAINYGGWQSELLHTFGVGIVLHPTDSKRASRRLLDALQDTEWLEAAGHRARALGESKFNTQMLTKQLENVLLRALDERHSRRVQMYGGSK